MKKRNYWLLKTEPTDFSIQDLKAKKTARWDGVRNYQARNNLRGMKTGDAVLIYHSSVAVPAIVGTATVVREAYPDPSQFDKNSPYYESRAREGDSVWDAIDVSFTAVLRSPVSLPELKGREDCKEMYLCRSTRLSVQPVEQRHAIIVMTLGKR